VYNDARGDNMDSNFRVCQFMFTTLMLGIMLLFSGYMGYHLGYDAAIKDMDYETYIQWRYEDVESEIQNIETTSA